MLASLEVQISSCLFREVTLALAKVWWRIAKPQCAFHSEAEVMATGAA
jgi:hypothetical protein